MNSQLEAYLHRVEAQLHSLPAEKRAAELRELRQHLEAMVARLSNDGLNQQEAVETALAQFGDAHHLGQALHQAHRAPESVPRFVLATVGAVGAYLYLFPLYKAAVWSHMPPGHPLPIQGLFYNALYWLLPFTSGLLAGGISTSRAGQSTACVGVLVAALMTTFFSFGPGTLLTFLCTLLAGVKVGSQRTVQFSLERSKG
ncbi:MAG: hypothetical protein JO316_10390 [Abitibacteriaceae bacterium]|nr:hypothetical protein [Abditibacteriaceae bacterium]